MNHKSIKSNTPQSGFSLIEMIIGLSVSISLIIIVIFSYMTLRRTFLLNTNIISMQHSAYVAEQILSRDIRTAGFAGCLRLNSGETIYHSANVQFDMDNRVHGYNSQQLPADMKFTENVIQHDSDIVVIEKISTDMALLKSLNKRKQYHIHELLMISDCSKRVIFYYTQNNLISELNNKNNFSIVAHIAPIEKIAFYIANTGRTTLSKSPIYALFRKNLWGENTEQTELVDGIDNMQVRYGIISPYSKQIIYYTASQINNWSHVSVIKIDLLFSSLGPVNFINQPMQYGNDKHKSPDERMRREWTITIGIREP